MGRRGRPHSFLEHWHGWALELPDGDVVRWVLMDDPQHSAPHAECFRTDRRGNLHPAEARHLLLEHGHPDAELVAVATHVGRGAFH